MNMQGDEPRSAQSSQVEVAMLTRNFFSAPHPLTALALIALVSFACGFLQSGLADIPRALLLGTGLFLLPSALGALVSTSLAKVLDGRFPMRRSMLLAFIELMTVFVLVLIRAALFPASDAASYLIFAFASTTWLRHVVLMSTSNSSHPRSLPVTLAYPVLGMLATALLFPPASVKHLVLAIVLTSVFLLMASLFLGAANRPLKKAFSINGLRMLSYFLDHREDREETAKVEAIFDSIASPVNAHVGVASFRTRTGVKAVMVVPSVHPGPFGTLGGSDLPRKLWEDLRTEARSVLVTHGPCTHDFNPPTSQECRKISAKVKEMLRGMAYSSEAGRFERRTNHANVSVQNLGGSGLVLVSLAPNPTDDLDFSTGYAVRERVKDSGLRDALVVDAHNCLSPGSGFVHFGSRTSMEIMETAAQSAMAALGSTGKGLRVGAAERRDLKIGSLGPMGIQAVVLEARGQRTAYILVDGNNMVPGLREEIIGQARGFVDEAEVMTSDNHLENVAYGSFNPVGMHGRKEIVQITGELVARAVGDLEDAEVGAATGIIEDFKVFGHENTTRIATLISTTVSALKVNAFLTLLISYALSVLAMLLIA